MQNYSAEFWATRLGLSRLPAGAIDMFAVLQALTSILERGVDAGALFAPLPEDRFVVPSVMSFLYGNAAFGPYVEHVGEAERKARMPGASYALGSSTKEGAKTISLFRFSSVNRPCGRTIG